MSDLFTQMNLTESDRDFIACQIDRLIKAAQDLFGKLTIEQEEPAKPQRRRRSPSVWNLRKDIDYEKLTQCLKYNLLIRDDVSTEMLKTAIEGCQNGTIPSERIEWTGKLYHLGILLRWLGVSKMSVGNFANIIFFSRGRLRIRGNAICDKANVDNIYSRSFKRQLELLENNNNQ